MAGRLPSQLIQTEAHQRSIIASRSRPGSASRTCSIRTSPRSLGIGSLGHVFERFASSMFALCTCFACIALFEMKVQAEKSEDKTTEEKTD